MHSWEWIMKTDPLILYSMAVLINWTSEQIACLSLQVLCTTLQLSCRKLIEFMLGFKHLNICTFWVAIGSTYFSFWSTWLAVCTLFRNVLKCIGFPHRAAGHWIWLDPPDRRWYQWIILVMMEDCFMWHHSVWSKILDWLHQCCCVCA